MAPKGKTDKRFSELIGNMSLSQKIFWMIALPLGLELTFVAVLLVSLNQLETESSKIEGTRAVSMAYNVEMQTMYEIMGAMVLFNVLHDTHYRQQLDASINFLMHHNEKMQNLGGSELADDARALQAVSEETVSSLSEIERLVKSDDRTDILRSFVKIQRLLKKANSLGAKYIAREGEITEEQNLAGQAARAQIKFVIIVGVIVSILLSILLLLLFGRSTRKKVSAIDENMNLLASHKPLAEPLKGKDELARIDQTLSKLSKELETLRSQQQQMYAMITHDLRSPLGTLKIMFELFDAGAFGELNEKGKNRVKTAVPVVDKLINLTNDLLDVEKLESGIFELRLEDTPMQEVFESCLAAMTVRADNKDVKLHGEHTDIIVKCDKERISRVISNFLDNALKFSDRGKSIYLSANREEKDLKISVRDEGRGISESARATVFEKFQQVEEKPGEKTEKGFGLGLAICKAIVQAHHGQIGVDSVPGEGSTFWFTLPL
ncbi:MAG TPA: HAMP domain-containing sensor histidine kinase [Drouetiella sp.]